MSRLEFSMDRLIKEVQKRKILYDITSGEYRDKKSKEREWIEVCRVLCTTNSEINDWDNLSETEKTDFLMEVKKKWTSLRDCFKRELKMYEKNEHNKRKYIFFDSLRFLESFCRNRRTYKDKVNVESKKIVQEEIYINDDNVKPEIINDDNVKPEILSSDSDSDVLDENPLSDLVECETNTSNRIKILTPRELSNYGGNDQKDFEKRKRKREIDKICDEHEKKKMVIRGYNENKGEASGSNETKRDMDENKSEEFDDDQAFLKSILPTFKALNTDQKFRLRIEIMQTILKFKVENKVSK